MTLTPDRRKMVDGVIRRIGRRFCGISRRFRRIGRHFGQLFLQAFRGRLRLVANRHRTHPQFLFSIFSLFLIFVLDHCIPRKGAHHRKPNVQDLQGN
jgi:hypothetical protein